jgi:hypothetical protein
VAASVATLHFLSHCFPPKEQSVAGTEVHKLSGFCVYLSTRDQDAWGSGGIATPFLTSALVEGWDM